MKIIKILIFFPLIIFLVHSESSFEISCKKCREEVSKCIENLGYNPCKESIAGCNKVCREYLKERSQSKNWDEIRQDADNKLYFYDSQFYKSLTDSQRILYEQINRAIEEQYLLFLYECIKKNEKIKPYVDNINTINHYCVIEKLQCFNQPHNPFAFTKLMLDLKIDEINWEISAKICQSILCDLTSKHN